jgi:CHAT domain-containing protein
MPNLHGPIGLKAKMADACWSNNEKTRSRRLFRDCLEYLDTLADPLHPALLEVYLRLHENRFDFYDQFSITKDFSRNITFILDKFFPSDHFYAGIFYTREAQMEYSRCDFENALQYSKHALEIISKYSFLNNYIRLNYYTVADGYFWLERDYEKTIAFCNQAITKMQQTSVSPTYMYYIKGLSYSMLNDKASAIKNLNQVIALASENESYRNNYHGSLAYHELGRIFLLENKHITARNYFYRGLELARKNSLKGNVISNIYRELGNSYNTTGNHLKALSCLQQSIIAGCHSFSDTSVYANPVLEDIVLTQNLIKCLTIKAYIFYSIYEKEENPLSHLVNSLKCQELAVKLIEKRVIDIDEEKSGMIIADLIRIPMNNTVSYAVLLYLRTGEKQYAEKAWEYAEKSKMQVLSINTMKKNNLLYSGLPDSLVRKNEILNNEILEIENQLALDEKYGRNNGSKDGALNKLARLYGKRDALTAYLDENYPVYKRLKYNFTVAGVDQIQQALDNDQVVLEYQLLSTEIITFVITKSDFHIHFQFIDKQVARSIAKLRDALVSNPLQTDPEINYREFTESSHYLYTKLIEPVYDKIKNKRLIIIPHNQLTLLPFEVLIKKSPVNDGPPDYRSLQYLIREFPVAYAFSANLLIDRDRERKYGTGTAIFLPEYKPGNNSAGSNGLLALEGAASEARTIKNLTGGRLYRGIKADKSTFKARANRYRVLHIASHTIVDEKNPGLSCLVMTAPADSNEDGNLYSYELMQMDLDAQLVVLSGCNTGYGLLRNSEGLVSIARSFFYTGVRTVAYTIWPVADQAGSSLVKFFYQGLRHRQTLDNALQEAKLSFLEKAEPVKAHPFYWAGYVIVGKTAPVPMIRIYTWLILTIPAVIIILVFFLYRRFRAKASSRSILPVPHRIPRRN